jgi:hypothetical protein
MGAIWFITKAIGDTGDASSENWHADFVAKTTSDSTRGLAVCRPDAIIPFKPVRPTDLISRLAGLFSNIFKTLYRDPAPCANGSGFAPAWV